MTDPATQQSLHEQLLAGDPTAPARVADALFAPLVERLRRAYPRVDLDLVTTAATDAWLSYVRKPGNFDPTKGKTLLGYLKMAAAGDLLNALDRLKRQRKGVQSLDEMQSVAVEEVLWNKLQTVEEDPLTKLEDREAREQAEAIHGRLDELFPDTTDRQLVELMLANERKTGSYARILGLQHLPKQEQQREVKRHKDRITKRLRRYGQELRNR
jgi:RNA polymerase sigma-70 factor (ECF subfamily)